jgi:hypothetical protein
VQAFTKTDAPALRHHNMDTLDTASARQMFRQIHGFNLQQLQQLQQQLKQQPSLFELEDQLLQTCSGMPLALRVIGGAMQVVEGTSAWDTYKLWKVRAEGA